jgi:poly(A) polymerase
VDSAPADPDRVHAALHRSLQAARGGQPRAPILLVRPEDLDGIDAEALRPALDELIVAKNADAGLDSLLTTGLLESLLPEVEAMVGFGDGEWRHKDVWKHTKQVVIQTVPKLEVRWSALFHDIGKVRTRTVSENGEVHFFGHAEVGARMFDKLDRRARLFQADEALKKEIRFLVLHHLRASGYEGQWTDSAVRRFTREMGPYLEDLLCLSRADITTKRPEKKRRGIRQIHDLSERVKTLGEIDAHVPPLPKGVGDFLVSEFGLPRSKIIGDIKRALEAACEAGEIESGQQSEYYVDFVAKHRRRFGLQE